MAGKKGKFSRARGVVALLVVALVIVGLAFRVGVGTPSAFGIDQISVICPLAALEVMLGAKEVLLHPLVLFVVVIVAIIIFGKAFCSWACPVPWLQRFFRPSKKKAKATSAAKAVRGEMCASDENDDASADAGGERRLELAGAAVPATVDSEAATASTLQSTSGEPATAVATALATADGESVAPAALPPVGGERDGVRIDSRHIVLLGALGSAAVFGFPVFCLVCPIGLTFATLIGVWNMIQFNEPSWALLAAPAIIILEVVFLRKWCSTICPLSALVSLVSSLNKTAKPAVDESVCARGKGHDCRVCVEVCPERVDPHTNLIPECSKCGACVDACPTKAIAFKLLKM